MWKIYHEALFFFLKIFWDLFILGCTVNYACLTINHPVDHGSHVLTVLSTILPWSTQTVMPTVISTIGRPLLRPTPLST